MSASFGFGCLTNSTAAGDRVLLAHGEGGRLMRKLLHDHVYPALAAVAPAGRGDAALLGTTDEELVFTTDSFVVSPLFFPGGDIGKLCVHGTVNDLAVMGARPRWISLSLILEEGLELTTLDAILRSIAAAALEANVTVVTGDTKVVPRGVADGLFINTAGIGTLFAPRLPGPTELACGDALLVSGPIGRHGMAVMAARESLNLRPLPTSDCASLLPAIAALRDAGVPLVALRDATRGGIAAVLHEWADDCGHALAIDEQAVPVTAEVEGACELLGLDPLHVANEGTMLVGVRAGYGEQARAAIRSVPGFGEAAIIGRVQTREVSPVLVRRGLGRLLPLDEPLGAPLPRIC
jgi:hydrogenase expression/formation protein HypE